jgi:hypothetical protein
MVTPRYQHTVTPLPNGRLLAVGGFGPAPLVTAESYNFVVGQWAPAAPMPLPRAAHTATLLLNGKVLVAGGDTGAGATPSALLYDPVSNTWGMVAVPMFAARRYHTATRLADGRVLVAGGDNGAPLASAEIFDPTSGLWIPTGSMLSPRTQHTAELLQDGRVLVVGGSNFLGPIPAAEIYDPTSGTWSPAATMGMPRTQHTTTLLPNGRVLAVDGNNVGPMNSCELYDAHVNAAVPTGVPATLELAPAKPNPFTRSARLEYSLPTSARVRLAVYDVRGRCVATLLDHDLPAGRYSATWDGRAASGARAHAGIYFARLTATGSAAPGRELQKLVLAE